MWLWAMGGRWGSRRTLLWAATHSTLPSAATHFSRPHCISLGSLHCFSTCVRVKGRGQCQGQAQVSGSDLAEGLGVGKRTREGRAKVKALRRKYPLGAKAMLRHNTTGERLAMTSSYDV